MGGVVRAVTKVAGVVAAGAFIVATGGLGAAAAAAVTGFLGVGAATIGLVASGLALGSSLLAPRPKAPAMPKDGIDRLPALIVTASRAR